MQGNALHLSLSVWCRTDLTLIHVFRLRSVVVNIHTYVCYIHDVVQVISLTLFIALILVHVESSHKYGPVFL